MESFIKYIDSTYNNTIIQDNYSIIRTPKCHTLRFDGVSIPNPGESAAAAIIYDQEGNIIARKSAYMKYANNNQAEHGALILGLELAVSLGIRNIKIEGDSEYVIYQLTGRYRIKDVYIYDITNKLLDEFDYVLIKHISSAENADADKECRDCLAQHTN